jgi:hypothetical protein
MLACRSNLTNHGALVIQAALDEMHNFWPNTDGMVPNAESAWAR